MRLGFACKILGADIPSHDARRWQNLPHLRVSIRYLHRMFDYLSRNGVGMYRMSSDVAPYYTDPSRPQFALQLEECREELAALGEKARRYDVRLSTHPGQYVVLNSPQDVVYQAAIRDLEYHADMLDLMGMPDDSKMILHVGGVYGERSTAMSRFAKRYSLLSDRVRARLVLENDDKSYSVDNVLQLHQETGAPVVFDVLHHRLLNPLRITENDAISASLSTWLPEQAPKIHYSDERTESRRVKRAGRFIEAGPARGQHADYIEPNAFASFLHRYRTLRDFDIMLESKAKDLALFRLRDDLSALGIQLAAA